MSDPGPGATRVMPDHVVGVFARERLSEALAATHRAGFGAYTRVLDGRRSSTVAQLERAGLKLVAEHGPAPDDLVIVVQAPGRIDQVSELFHQLGAEVVVQAQRASAQSARASRDLLVPDIALADRSNPAVDAG